MTATPPTGDPVVDASLAVLADAIDRQDGEGAGLAWRVIHDRNPELGERLLNGLIRQGLASAVTHG